MSSALQLGVIGLGTMGANLARNAKRNGVTVAVYNRTAEKTKWFMEEYGGEGDFLGCSSIEELCASLEPPRPILLMVKAGEPVDAMIASLIPLLQGGDIIIDGGNSHYPDTERRVEELSSRGIRFLGMGISGGEKGALEGASMMPGGDESAYRALEPLLMKMAAKVDDGQKSVAYIGQGGSGHFVKMVHNGIEYGIMQLIAESYDLLKCEAGKSNEELAGIYAAWNEGEDLSSFLMEITAKIFARLDDDASGRLYLIDCIKDVAGQKGTGKWTTEAAMEFGVPIPTINAAVDARILSGDTRLRAKGRELSPESIEQPYPKPEKLTSRVRTALELSIICVYMQGFELMRTASAEKGWNLDIGEIARIWRGGCIIRSAFLSKIQAVYGDDKSAAKNAKEAILSRFDGERQLDWRRAVAIGAGRGIPLPSMSASLSYYDTLRRKRLPQNLIQAQRDFFGAHGFERVDTEGVFHAKWG